MRATVAQGFGSVAVLWKHANWSETDTVQLSERILVVELQHTTGQGVRVVGGHVHHDSVARKGQWKLIDPCLECHPEMATVFLMDHNSLLEELVAVVAMPSANVWRDKPRLQSRAAWQARRASPVHLWPVGSW